jgi:hypothetical protein
LKRGREKYEHKKAFEERNKRAREGKVNSEVVRMRFQSEMATRAINPNPQSVILANYSIM